MEEDENEQEDVFVDARTTENTAEEELNDKLEEEQLLKTMDIIRRLEAYRLIHKLKTCHAEHKTIVTYGLFIMIMTFGMIVFSGVTEQFTLLFWSLGLLFYSSVLLFTLHNILREQANWFLFLDLAGAVLFIGFTLYTALIRAKDFWFCKSHFCARSNYAPFQLYYILNAITLALLCLLLSTVVRTIIKAYGTPFSNVYHINKVIKNE